MRDLARGHGMTMLVVTHEMHFARDVGDRVVFMDEGKIVEQGRPADVLDNPREERTRRFLRRSLELDGLAGRTDNHRGRRSRGMRRTHPGHGRGRRRRVRRRDARLGPAHGHDRRRRGAEAKAPVLPKLPAEIAARKRLIVGVKCDTPPFGYLDVRGKNAGVDVEIAKQFARYAFGTRAAAHVRLRTDGGPRAAPDERPRRPRHLDVHVHVRPRHADRLLAALLQGVGAAARQERLADPALSPTSAARRWRRRAARSTTAG